MKWKRSFAVLAFGAFLTASCAGCAQSLATSAEPAQKDLPAASASAALTPAATPCVETKVEKTVLNVEGSFASRLTAALVADGKQNVALSPLSVQMALAMAYAGASGQTAEEIKQTMGFTASAQEEIAKLADLIAAYEQAAKDGAFSLSMANAVVADENLQLKDAYEGLLESLGAQKMHTDFQDVAKTLNVVNGWVKENTNGKIDKILSDVSPGTVAYLINALYFKAGWSRVFAPSLTKPQVFHSPQGDVQADMMHNQLSPAPYLENETLQAVRLSFNGGCSFTAFLPKQGRETAFESALGKGELDGWLQSEWQPRTVDLSLPKFDVDEETSLKDVLSAMGMPTAFTGDADFTGLSDGRFLISEVLHRVAMTVNEEGAEGAAVTAVAVAASSMYVDKNEPVALTFDRPFLYVLQDIRSGQTLFCGWVADPTAK